MIKANELRVGNFVISKTHNILNAVVEGIGINPIGLCFLEQVSTYDLLRDLEPIPLTEEWLLKFGFEETETDGIYINSKRGILKVEINKIGLVSFKIGEIIFSTVHYVHQLQNLYFALTGQELKVKEDVLLS